MTDDRTHSSKKQMLRYLKLAVMAAYEHRTDDAWLNLVHATRYAPLEYRDRCLHYRAVYGRL